MSNRKHILIIAFRFPPMGGVGSRRWAKFTKYLALMGYHVHVVTVDYPYQDKINWTHDVGGEHITIHRCKAGYPLWMLRPHSGGAFRKIVDRVFRLTLGRFWYYLDAAQRWGRHMLPLAKRIIVEHGIKNVMVTAPPSSLHYVSSFLKVDKPGINLIQDYRDPWNSDVDYSFPDRLKYFWQKERSAYMEWFAVAHSDKVVVNTNDMRANLSSLYREYSGKILTIPNGFDPDDFPAALRGKSQPGLKFIYTGSVSHGRAMGIKILAKAIFELKDAFLDENFECHVYGNTDAQAFKGEAFYPVIEKNFRFHEMVGPSQVLGIMATFPYCLSINAPYDSHAFGSKVFDYMALDKKILHIADKGELYELIVAKGQYAATYKLDSVKEALLRIKSDHLAGAASASTYDEFSIPALAKRFEALFV